MADLKISAPQDFRNLYQQVNGFVEPEWNEHMFSLWLLERITKEYYANESGDYIGFCDFLINSHSIGFYKPGGGIYKSNDLSRPIADSFAEILEMINTSLGDIY